LSHRTDAPAKIKANADVIFMPANPGRRLVSVGIPKDHPIRTNEAITTIVNDNA
jgi:hypothetical protein